MSTFPAKAEKSSRTDAGFRALRAEPRAPHVGGAVHVAHHRQVCEFEVDDGPEQPSVGAMRAFERVHRHEKVGGDCSEVVGEPPSDVEVVEQGLEALGGGEGVDIERRVCHFLACSLPSHACASMEFRTPQSIGRQSSITRRFVRRSLGGRCVGPAAWMRLFP